MCSGEADFLQGFTALLRDVSLRERFEKNPRGVAALLCADESAAANLAAIQPKDLRFQAEVLIRKRFAKIKAYMPQTIADLESRGFLIFRDYIEQFDYRENRKSPLVDAINYLRFVAQVEHIQCDRELNRLRFLTQRKRVAVKWVFYVKGKGWNCPALQLLLRQGNGCRDFLLSF